MSQLQAMFIVNAGLVLFMIFMAWIFISSTENMKEKLRNFDRYICSLESDVRKLKEKISGDD